MKFVLHRDRVIATRFGHILRFKKGVPLHVPREAHKEVIAAGGVPEGELDDEPTVKPDPQGDERAALVQEALREIVEKNDREAFSAAGLPHTKAIAEILGFKVTADERDAAWAKFNNRDD